MADPIITSEEQTALTRGVRTTEFWLALAAIAASVLAVSGVLGDGSTALRVVGLIGATLTQVVYALVRGWVKTS